MKVLVTGGAGFIGRAVCQELLNSGHEPVILDHRRGFTGYGVVLGDVRDATSVNEAVAHVDGVIHLAGILGTQETIGNPLPAAETNIFGGLNVLQACAQYSVPLVNIAVGNWPEENTYSITKTTVERFTRMYGRYRSVQACSVRAYNAYGPGQAVAHPFGASRVRKIIPSFVAGALHDDETIQVYGDGSQVMDMIFVDDVARCLVTALENMDSLAGGVYAAGTARRTTVLDIAKMVQAEVVKQAGITPEIEHLPMRPGETPGSEVQADADDVRALGVDPEKFVTLEDGLRLTVAYYRKLFG